MKALTIIGYLLAGVAALCVFIWYIVLLSSSHEDARKLWKAEAYDKRAAWRASSKTTLIALASRRVLLIILLVFFIFGAAALGFGLLRDLLGR